MGGGGQFLDFMGGHSCYEGGHRAYGGSPTRETLDVGRSDDVTFLRKRPESLTSLCFSPATYHGNNKSIFILYF